MDEKKRDWKGTPVRVASPDEPVELPKAPPPPPAKELLGWRVKADRKIGWDGHQTVIRAGCIVTHATYGGPEGLQKLRVQGVELEPVFSE